MPYIGVSPQFGVRRKHTYTATAGQTSFSGAGSEGATLSYKDSNFVDVYQNGVKLGDADYTSTSGTAIVLAQGASVDDLVEIIVFDAFSAADTVSKADGGTFDGNVTMGGTLDVTGNGTVGGTLGVTGVLTANAGIKIDNITIDGTEIDLSSGDVTIDAALDIKLDAAGGDIKFLSDGTEFGEIRNISNDLTVISSVADKDIVFKGQDDSSEIEAMRIDMSEGGIVKVGDDDSGSAGVAGIQIQNSQDFSTVFDATNTNTFAGMQTVNHDDTSNSTGTGITFVHRSSSSGVASIQSTSAASDRADLRFITRGSDGINERASITEAGYLKQNKLPMFQIAGTGNTSVTGTGYLTYTTSTGFTSSTEYDPDSLFDGSNGRFTAPVAGRYFFIFSIGVSFTSSYHYTSLQKNGSDISGFSRNQQQEDDYDIQVIQGIVDLSLIHI